MDRDSYYPGFKLSVFTVRSPYSPMKKHLFPAVCIGVLITGIFNIDKKLISERLKAIAIS